MVLICLIFSVLSTIEEYSSFANESLFWMVINNFTASVRNKGGGSGGVRPPKV